MYHVFILLQGCDCPDDYYELKSLNIYNWDITNNQSIIDSLVIDYENFAIELDFSLLETSNNIDYDLGHRLYAFSCDGPNLLRNKFVSVNIYSSEDYDLNHVTGVSLNEYFTLYLVYRSNCENLKNCGNNVGNLSLNYFNDNLAELFEYDNIKNLALYIVPNKKSDFDEYQQFTVELELEDGTKMSSTTSFVKFE